MRYSFHVTHRHPMVDDTLGIDLPDRKAAWGEATRACGEMLKEIDGTLAFGTDWRMDVNDERGPIFSIHFGAERLDHPKRK